MLLANVGIGIVEQGLKSKRFESAVEGRQEPNGPRVAAEICGGGVLAPAAACRRRMKLCTASAICRRLFLQTFFRAASRAAWTAGSKSATSTAMIAIDTSNSTRVKAELFPRLSQCHGIYSSPVNRRPEKSRSNADDP
jgi:hypothetical protein